MNEEYAKWKTDEYYRELIDDMRADAVELLDTIFNDYTPNGELETLLIEGAINRASFVKDFSLRKDKVLVIHEVQYLYCSSIIRDPFNAVPIQLMHVGVHDDPLVNRDITLKQMLKIYRDASNRVRDSCRSGAYIYPSASHIESPITDSKKEYLELLKWREETFSLDDVRQNGSMYVNDYHENCYVSRSELNQLLAFAAPLTSKSDYQTETRKAAYRAHLRGELGSSDAVNFLINEKRELVLVGWMLGKGFNTDGRIKGYSQKTAWAELEASGAECFKSSAGKPLTAHSIKAFFKECRNKGICKFK